MPGREEMLVRIRKALGRTPGQAGEVPPTVPTMPVQPRDVMPPVSRDELVPKFEAELREVSGSTHRASTAMELEAIIRKILDASGATSVVLSRNPLLADVRLAEKLRALGITVSAWPERGPVVAPDESKALREFAAASFAATVGITGVDFALAETGSLVLTSLTEGSQLASLAPPIHVALYRRSQVVGSLDEVLEKLSISRDRSFPSLGRSVVFITGPSRTADIEQILIRGVHGPREVHAILVEESALM